MFRNYNCIFSFFVGFFPYSLSFSCTPRHGITTMHKADSLEEGEKKKEKSEGGKERERKRGRKKRYNERA